MQEPEPKKELVLIERKVQTLKFIRTHLRWGALVVQFSGWLFNVPQLFWGGLLFFLATYLMSIGVMEDITLAVWDASDEKEKDKDTEDDQRQDK